MIIPIFPLNMVAFPKMPVPLHIFEDRYKAMLEYCMREKAYFGIVLSQNNNISKTGCAMLVTKVFQEYSDGRKDILAVGRQRFRIKAFDYDDVYLKAEVEFFDDPRDESELNADLDKLTLQTLDLYKQYLKKVHPHKAENYQVFFEEPYNQVSFRMASAITGEYALKQKLLEMVSEEERLVELGLYFSSKVMRNASAHPLIKELQEGHSFSNN
jgi:Lon protease-like protein